MDDDVIAKAEALFRAGRMQQGMDVLGDAARRGHGGSLEALAHMAISGDIVERDLRLSRDLFRRAAEAGSRSAASIYRGFVANGTGGPADWRMAITLLEKAAPDDEDATEELALLKIMAVDSDGAPTVPYPEQMLSISPEVRKFAGLFTAAECDFLIERSQRALAPSLVVDPHSGQQVPNPVRTSDAAAYPLLLESPVIYALCNRLAAASGTHVKAGEPLQVLRYRPGQEYRPHFDAIANAENQRVLTFLVYLNDDYKGGETEFLASELKVSGRKGDGLLFRNANSDGSPDPQSQHAGLPVTAGEKYLASRWIRAKQFTPT